MEHRPKVMVAFSFILFRACGLDADLPRQRDGVPFLFFSVPIILPNVEV